MRTREGGDGWISEPPLAEQSERYQLTIYADGEPVRTVETSAPSHLYEAGEIAADFGPQGPGKALTFAVAQISDAVGPGQRGGDYRLARLLACLCRAPAP